jgi:hypothetical protein
MTLQQHIDYRIAFIKGCYEAGQSSCWFKETIENRHIFIAKLKEIDYICDIEQEIKHNTVRFIVKFKMTFEDKIKKISEDLEKELKLSGLSSGKYLYFTKEVTKRFIQSLTYEEMSKYEDFSKSTRDGSDPDECYEWGAKDMNEAILNKVVE